MQKSLLWLAILGVTLSAGSGCTRSGTPPAPPPTVEAEAPATPAAVASGAQTSPIDITDFRPDTNFGSTFLSDHRLFWVGWTSGDARGRKVYSRDLRTGAVKVVAEPAEGYQLGSPVVTGDWLAFGEFPHQDQAAAWRLVAIHLGTGERRLLASAEVGATQLTYAADADRIVWREADWSDMRTSWSRIMVYDFSAATTTVIAQEQFPNNLESVDIWGQRVVYTRFTTTPGANAGEPNHFASDVYLFDLATGSSQRLSSSHDAWHVRMNGDNVIWQVAPHAAGYGDVVLYSLAAGTSRRITKDGEDLGVFHPTLGQGFVTWRENLGQKRRILAYLIEEGRTLELDQGQVFAPVARGKYLTWRWEPSPGEARIRWWTPEGS